MQHKVSSSDALSTAADEIKPKPLETNEIKPKLLELERIEPKPRC